MQINREGKAKPGWYRAGRQTRHEGSQRSKPSSLEGTSSSGIIQPIISARRYNLAGSVRDYGRSILPRLIPSHNQKYGSLAQPLKRCQQEKAGDLGCFSGSMLSSKGKLFLFTLIFSLLFSVC